MKSVDKGVVVQLRQLLKDGISLEDACEALQLDIDAVRMYLETASSKRVMTAEELISEYKPKAIAALASYALDPMEEWCPAKVGAAIFLAKGEGELPEFPVDKLSDMFKKMRGVVDEQDVSVSLTNKPSNSTIVEVKSDVAKKKELKDIPDVMKGMQVMNN